MIISKLLDKLVYRYTRGVSDHRHKFEEFPTLKTFAIIYYYVYSVKAILLVILYFLCKLLPLLGNIVCPISLVINHVYMISVQPKQNCVPFENVNTSFIGALSWPNFLLMKGLTL